MKTIAVALDGTESSQSAVPWAKLMAGPNTEVHLIRAFRDPRDLLYTSVGPVPGTEELVEEVIEQVHHYLKEQAGAFEQPVKMHAGCGDPAETILYQAGERKADLIIMASHGRGGLERWLLGSVATKVLRGSQTPVLVVRADAMREAPEVKKILVPLDGSETSELALDKAVEVAKQQKAALILYTGLSLPRTGFPSAVQQYLENGMKGGQEYLDNLAGKCSGVPVEAVVRDTTPGHGITEAAIDLGADLIVMGSHGRNGVRRWMLGSVTENVVQTSEVPVLVVYESSQRVSMKGRPQPT